MNEIIDQEQPTEPDVANPSDAPDPGSGDSSPAASPDAGSREAGSREAGSREAGNTDTGYPGTGDDAGGTTPPGGGATPGASPGPTSPPPPPQRWLRRAERGPVAGVATGIADYFRVDPVLVQAAFVAFTIFGGSGFLLYLAGWLLIPKAADPDTRPVAVATGSTPGVVFGVIFLVGAASTLFGSFSFGAGGNALVPLLLIGGGLFLLNQRADRPDVIAGRAAAAPTSAHWAAPRTMDEVAAPIQQPFQPTVSEPAVPVTSVTLAIAAMVAGSLVAFNQWTDSSISATGVIGTALAIVGGGLVFSAFKGRAFPLIPVGLLLTAALFVSPVFDAMARGGVGDRLARPTSEAEIVDRYDLGAGPFEIDLRNVEFVDDRTIIVDIGAGHADIIVPDDVRVHVEATNGAGAIELFGTSYEGVAHSASATRSPVLAEGEDEADVPQLDVIVNVTFGLAEVRRG